MVLGHTTRDAQMLVLVEPHHVKVAATLGQLAKKGLDGVDRVQQLESVCRAS
jgi:hypothetical protein